jgi:hypothetical protein
MKNLRSILGLAFLMMSVLSFGQAKQKITNDLMEYVGADYDFVSQGTVLKLKNSKGETLFFHYALSDQTKVEEILFNKPSDPTTAKSVSKSELVGHKFNVGYTPISANDPANSACCFKIISVSEVQANGSTK